MTSMKTGIVAITVLCLAVSACAGDARPGQGSFPTKLSSLIKYDKFAGDVERGHAIAERWCATCHTLEFSSFTTDRAPSFPYLSTRSNLTTARLRGILANLPHPMPPIQLSNQQIEDLISYMRQSATLQK